MTSSKLSFSTFRFDRVKAFKVVPFVKYDDYLKIFLVSWLGFTFIAF